MRIRDISKEQIVLEAPVGVMQRAKEKIKAAPPTWMGGSVDAKRQNLVSSEINRVWKLVKQELKQELKNEYVPVNYFLEVMKDLGYLTSAQEVVKAELGHVSPEEQRWENVKKGHEENIAGIERIRARLASLKTSKEIEQEEKEKEDEIEKDRERHLSNFSDSKKYTKRPLREESSQVLDSKTIQDLIKKTIELAAKNNPDEFAKRAVGSSLSKRAEDQGIQPDKSSPKSTEERPSTTGEVSQKPFQKAFDQAKSRVISKVPRGKERDAAYDELQDIFKDLYSRL